MTAAACGTYAGWARHKRHAEPPCEPCVTAQRAYHRTYRASGRKNRTPDARQIKVCASCEVAYSTTYRKGRFCSHLCYQYDRHGPLSCDVPRRHPSRDHEVPSPRKQPDLSHVWRSQRKPLRAGYEDGDAELFFAALVADADTTGSCWVWPQLNQRGYPIMRAKGREVALHRAVLEMKHGRKLGSQAAHHICASPACVNPEHLQPVTHRDNVAEMLARHSYLARIRELEDALATVSPRHPLLSVIEVA